MVRALPGQERQLVLRLWAADVRAADGNTPLWVGNVTRHHVSKKIPLFTVARSEAVFSQPLAEFERTLDGLEWKRVQRMGLREARYNHWNSEVILLRAAPGN